MYGAVCVRCTLSVCALFVEQSEDTGCLRAAPLLRGLVLKSGHEHVFPPSFHLPLHPPLSFCLLAPSFFFLPLCSSPQPYPSSCDSFFLIYFLSSCRRVQSRSIRPHPSPLWLHLTPLHPSLSICLSPLLLSLYAHICDQIMRHIMGLVSLMACIKGGELRDG